MIALVKIKEAERLLAEGKLSHRKIALAVGISRATVGAIATGKRPDYESRRLEQANQVEPVGPLERCPGCGGLVHTPCRLCRLRQARALEQEVARACRQRAREKALKRLLAAVWKASQERETAEKRGDHMPPAPDGKPLDCK